MMSEQHEVYAHSGALGGGVIVAPLAAAVAAVVLGVAYGFADAYSPLVYLSFVLVIGLAFILGWSVGRAGLFAKCRNVTFVVVAALLAGLLALYIQWATFIYAQIASASDEPLTFSLLDTMLNPAFVWELVRQISIEGWFTVFGATPSGAVLWGIWVIEALVIVIGAPMAAAYAYADHVFCEHCGVWCRAMKNHFRLAIPSDEQELERLAAGDLDAIAAAPNIAPGAAPALRVDQHVCDSCADTATMRIKLVKLKTDGKKVEENVDDFSPQFLLTPQTRKRVDELAARPPVEPVADPADATDSAADGMVESEPDSGPPT